MILLREILSKEGRGGYVFNMRQLSLQMDCQKKSYVSNMCSNVGRSRSLGSLAMNLKRLWRAEITA